MELEAKSPLYEQFLETMSGICTVRAFAWEIPSRKRNQLLLDAFQQPAYLLYCVQTWLSFVLDLTVAGLAVVVVGLGIGLQGKVNSGSIGVALLNLTSLGATLKNVIVEWASLDASMGAIQRLEAASMDTPRESVPTDVHEPPKEWPSVGSIEFLGVTASYRYVKPLGGSR